MMSVVVIPATPIQYSPALELESKFRRNLAFHFRSLCLTTFESQHLWAAVLRIVFAVKR
jgi:hypothetical protein